MFVEAAVDRNPQSWGLDRIDQANLPLNKKFDYGRSDGTGVEAFILDSGIRLSHTDFGGRARCGFNAFDKTYGTGCDDATGHGSHVAGTLGGTIYGVAKNVQLIAVKVLNSRGKGTLSSIVAGIDYVTGEKHKRPNQPMVANMSIVGDRVTPALELALQHADQAGVIFVVAAGNGNRDACRISPPHSNHVISVGSTQRSDERSEFSNYGSCVDIFAPGTAIRSVGIRDDNAKSTISGTSMAAPHVSGAIALYLEKNPRATTSEIMNTLITVGAKRKVKNRGKSSPNVLLNIKNLKR